jgi:hypothetical protein
MRRLAILILLAAPALASFDSLPRLIEVAAAAEDVSAKEAFDAAKELGTAEAWNAFLESYPSGFHADLARAYLKKLGAAGSAPTSKKADTKSKEPAKKQATQKPPPEPADDDSGEGRSSIARTENDGEQPSKKDKSAAEVDAPAAEAGAPAIARSAKFMGFPEKFNRYYTDPDWKPSRILYVSPDGSGNGSSRDAPMPVEAAIAEAAPGTQVFFLRGDYEGCFEMQGSGTYDEPIVLYGERNDDKSLGVKISCCTSGRQTCFNLENADYIAVDGFDMTGGKYGVRVVGSGYAAAEHSRGIAVLNCKGQDQARDPFFSGQTDWAVWEGNVASGAKEEDGHGIYLSNGGDWNIVRFNETFGNASSDFQINADPISTCKEEGIPYDDPRCDAFAGEDGGGQGASDYFLVDGNHFHNSNVGPNFTSVRRSVVRNNIFGPQERHNASFWQETDNPKLGSSENKILHNLFITTDRHAAQFANSSTRNLFANNLVLGVQLNKNQARGNADALVIEVDEASRNNEYRGNVYVAGKMEGHEPTSEETVEESFSPGWFAKFPSAMSHTPGDYTPTSEAPFAGKATRFDDAPKDRNGQERGDATTPGPIELP